MRYTVTFAACIAAAIAFSTVCAAADKQTIPAAAPAASSSIQAVAAQSAVQASTAPAVRQATKESVQISTISPSQQDASPVVRASTAPLASVNQLLPSTLNNLMAAYSIESNAKAKYLKFAEKAEKEGYLKVAQLFRAAARSEEIHAGIHARAIAELGGAAKADIKPREAGATEQNLTDAINEEGYAVQSQYPKYLEKAKAENANIAAISFSSGLKIEPNLRHAFEEAVIDVKAWKKAGEGFYVCRICGNLATRLDFTQCAVCGAPPSEFELIK